MSKTWMIQVMAKQMYINNKNDKKTNEQRKKDWQLPPIQVKII